jgi:hypothetical protein
MTKSLQLLMLCFIAHYGKEKIVAPSIPLLCGHWYFFLHQALKFFRLITCKSMSRLAGSSTLRQADSKIFFTE